MAQQNPMKQIFNTPGELQDVLREKYTGMRRVATVTWSANVQHQVAADLQRIVSELDDAIKHAKLHGDGETANAWRALQTFIQSIVAEVSIS